VFIYSVNSMTYTAEESIGLRTPDAL